MRLSTASGRWARRSPRWAARQRQRCLRGQLRGHPRQRPGLRVDATGTPTRALRGRRAGLGPRRLRAPRAHEGLSFEPRACACLQPCAGGADAAQLARSPVSAPGAARAGPSP
eukprot:2070364-Alexandrium_andersonii.AAC.1